MATPCTLHFFVKISVNPPPMTTMTTVVWKLGTDDAARGGQNELKVTLSKSLKTLGPLQGLYFHIYPFMDAPGSQWNETTCMEKLKDPAMKGWVADALAISLHSVVVEPTTTPILNPFCPETI